jgi:hypothetical protein
MESIIFFTLGVLITVLVTQKPIKIEVKHIHEDLQNIPDPVKMEEYEKILAEDKPEANLDDAYEKMGEVNDAVAEVFGGSDRV